MPFGRARYRLKVEAYDSAAAVLGAEALGIYEQNGDAKWLERNNPYQGGQGEKISQKASD